MDKIRIVDEIRSNKRLLSLPQVLSDILHEVGKDDYSADSLAKIILKDPSLTGNLLKVANSALYISRNEIKTVHQAVQHLGVTSVKCLALSTSIFHPKMIGEQSGINQKDFFSYVISIAAASEKIAKMVNYPTPEEALIAGLLTDIGIMFFIHHYPDSYYQIVKGRNHNESLLVAEKKVFGIDHCEVGMHLAKTWKLPEYIATSVSEHHSALTIDRKNVLGNIVKLAVQLSTDNFSGKNTNLEDRLTAIDRLFTALNLRQDNIDEISSTLMGSSLKMSEYLGVDIGDHEEMLIKANQEIWKTYLTIESLFNERQELSRKLLMEEHDKGAIEAKNIAMATLSHYINNSAMAIYGRSQIMRMLLEKGKMDRLTEQIPVTLETIDKAVRKIVAVLDEMKEISPINHDDFYNVSSAMNIDDKIEERTKNMIADSKWNHNPPLEKVSD